MTRGQKVRRITTFWIQRYKLGQTTSVTKGISELPPQKPSVLGHFTELRSQTAASILQTSCCTPSPAHSHTPHTFSPFQKTKLSGSHGIYIQCVSEHFHLKRSFSNLKQPNKGQYHRSPAMKSLSRKQCSTGSLIQHLHTPGCKRHSSAKSIPSQQYCCRNTLFQLG